MADNWNAEVEKCLTAVTKHRLKSGASTATTLPILIAVFLTSCAEATVAAIAWLSARKAFTVLMPLREFSKLLHNWQQRYEEVVDSLAIGHIVRKKPLECSGGEKARANFARAVMLRPRILLADEPTASLDPENRERILSLLFGLSREHSATIVTVTHDLYVADRHGRVLQLRKRKD